MKRLGYAGIFLVFSLVAAAQADSGMSKNYDKADSIDKSFGWQKGLVRTDSALVTEAGISTGGIIYCKTKMAFTAAQVSFQNPSVKAFPYKITSPGAVYTRKYILNKMVRPGMIAIDISKERYRQCHMLTVQLSDEKGGMAILKIENKKMPAVMILR